MTSRRPQEPPPIVVTFRDYLQRKGVVEATCDLYAGLVWRALSHGEGPIAYLGTIRAWQSWRHAAYALRRYARMMGDTELRGALADLEALDPPERPAARPLALPTPEQWQAEWCRAWSVVGEKGAILYLMVASGLRIGDLLRMPSGMIHAAAASGSAVVPQKGPRGRRRIWAPGLLGMPGVARLAPSLRTEFLWQALSPQSQRAAYAQCAGWCRAPFHPHVFRHATITYLVRASVPLTTIQQITGHASLSALERYIHSHVAVSAQDVDAAQRRMLDDMVRRGPT